MLALGFIALVGLDSWAFAHARLLRTEPAIGSIVATSPKYIELRFSERLETSLAEVEVIDAAGTRVDQSDATVDRETRKLLRTSLKPLPDGSYTVTWRALSVDSHVIRGSFTFHVARSS